MILLNGIPFRNRTATSASLAGYGAKPAHRFIPYGLSPIAQFMDLGEVGAVTTRTLTLEPRDGHFTVRTDWDLRDWPQLIRRYRRVIRRIDAGWLNAFGWANIGIDAYLRDYFPRTEHLNRIISLGGFSAAEFDSLIRVCNERIPQGRIAAVELNLSCHNVNADFAAFGSAVIDTAAALSRHPVIVKLAPDSDYLEVAAHAESRGIAALTAINTVKGLRLNPDTGEPLMTNYYGGMSGRCIKPIALRVVAELRQAGISLPIIATGGVRTFADAREFFWAGADVVSIGSEGFLAPPFGYVLSPTRARQLDRLRKQIVAYEDRLEHRDRVPRRRDETVSTGVGVASHAGRGTGSR